MVLVVVVAACAIRTEYVPRSTGRAAIGLENGELGVYKNGSFRKLTASDAPLLGCSPGAAAVAVSAATYHASYDKDMMISGSCYAVSSLFPILVPFGIVYGLRAAGEQSSWFALTVDAVNMHNDAPACVAGGAP